MLNEPTELLSGWGNYPRVECKVFRPSTWSAVQEQVARGETLISRGLGRAYGDSAIHSPGVMNHTAFDRILDFDPENGVIECEAGVSFESLIGFLQPRGWFVPTTPGSKFVTVGGAVASDVHGKNHHRDGSFGDFVDHLDILLASGEVVRCSTAERPDLFSATIGGMGLTGAIMSVRFRLHRVQTAYYDVTYTRTKDLDESLQVFESTDKSARYSVAWIDCLASGKSLGRSVVMTANDAIADQLSGRQRRNPLVTPPKVKVPVPFDAPSFALNSFSVRAFNTLYYAKNKSTQRVVDWDTFFYPLDSVLNWNRIYGRRGFVQFQALVPAQKSRAGLVALLERISQEKRASFLAVLKASGKKGAGLLSYLFPGHTLALDFPNFGDALIPFMNELDKILLDFGGRLYLAKDATTNIESFRAMYPELPEFLARKATFDPNNRFQSAQARRLGLLNS